MQSNYPHSNNNRYPNGFVKQENSSLPPFAALPPKRDKGIHQRNVRILYVFYCFLPVIIALLISGTILIVMQFQAISAAGQVKNENFASAKSTYENQVRLTGWGFSPWVAEYNLGTVYLQQGDWETASQWLSQAFQTVPKAVPTPEGTIQTFSYECQVRINLAVSWEGLGDSQAAEDQTEAANQSYANALDWVSVCELSDSGSSENPDEGQQQQQQQPDEGSSTSERIEQKRRELNGEEPEETQQTPDSNEGEGQEEEPSEDPFAGESQEEKERREELEQKNNDQKERDRQRDESYNRGSGSNGW